MPSWRPCGATARRYRRVGTDRPLEGLRVLVTRAADQAGDLVERLRVAGAIPRVIPVIAIAPPADPAPLREALARLEAYDWLLFTSANAVRALPGDLGSCRVACVGQATAAALAERGVRVDLVPERFVAEGLLEALRARLGADLGGVSFLLPRAAEAREAVPEGLRAMGARVDVVEAYRTVPCTEGRAEALRLLREGEMDALTFTSSSTVRHFDALLGEAAAEARRVPCVVIGPIAADTARALGYDVVAVAEPSTAEGLVRALERVSVRRRSPG